jgi:hypothetical protein
MKKYHFGYGKKCQNGVFFIYKNAVLAFSDLFMEKRRTAFSIFFLLENAVLAF